VTRHNNIIFSVKSIAKNHDFLSELVGVYSIYFFYIYNCVIKLTIIGRAQSEGRDKRLSFKFSLHTIG